MFKHVIHNPYLNLISGFVLLVTAGLETWSSIDDATIGMHHGILIFSIIHITKAIPEVMHGFKELDEATDEVQSKFNR